MFEEKNNIKFEEMLSVNISGLCGCVEPPNSCIFNGQNEVAYNHEYFALARRATACASTIESRKDRHPLRLFSRAATNFEKIGSEETFS